MSPITLGQTIDLLDVTANEIFLSSEDTHRLTPHTTTDTHTEARRSQYAQEDARYMRNMRMLYLAALALVLAALFIS